MGKFQISVENPNEAIESDRRLVNIKVTSHLENFAEDRRSSLKSITLSQCKLNAAMLKQIVDEFENLESLCLDQIEYWTGESLEIASLEHKKLKRLKVVRCHPILLEYFHAVPLTLFHFENPTIAPEGKLANFISSQTQLVSLNITIDIATSFWVFMTNTFKITGKSDTLKKLTIDIHSRSDYDAMGKIDEDNFINFLKLRAQNLEEFFITSIPSNEIFEFVVTELKKLQKVAVRYTMCPMSVKLYQNRARVSPSLNELIFCRNVIDKELSVRMLGPFPNLKKITARLACRPMLVFISNELHKMESFTCETLPMGRCKYKFKALKELHVDEITHTRFLSGLLLCNPNIERVTIKKCAVYFDDNRKLVTALAQAKSIRSMKIQGDKQAMEMFFENIRITKWSETLEVLELVVVDDVSFKRPFIFYLPKHKSLWKPVSPLGTIVEIKKMMN